jgi:hypothetical protein
MHPTLMNNSNIIECDRIKNCERDLSGPNIVRFNECTPFVLNPIRALEWQDSTRMHNLHPEAN